jgi:hypothetical protein
LFKKPGDEIAPPVKTQPLLKEFGMDPEHRKYVFSEEYANGSERSLKDELNKEDRERGIRRKSPGVKTRQDDTRRRIGNKPFKIFVTSIETTANFSTR